MIQWPPHSKITCFNLGNQVIAKSRRSRLDLSDSLMLHNDAPFSCSIEVLTKDQNWTTWNNRNVREIENHIIYDLEFDGYTVKIERVSNPSRALCSRPFKWNLKISEAYGEDDLDYTISKQNVGSRFKVARSDAKASSIQRTIEKIFGLPIGCVCLLTPDQRKFNAALSIRKLRDKWKHG